ncbi:helix-turn-helix transcriptional regulator [Ekhidna sp.]|uniref:helix-turn-helix transcriptional regulator n=1 Tax=Ekhidna sp. TaxID=2608089 RepID=UPI003CCBA0B7
MRNSLKVERAKVEITQEELAARVNTTRLTINKIEKGKSVPSVALALRIAKFFKVSVESIFQLDELENEPK